jgi:hypothetical protein
MTFEAGKIYTHRRMQDAAVYVRHVEALQGAYYTLLVEWVSTTGRRLGASETIEIDPDELPNWYEINF